MPLYTYTALSENGVLSTGDAVAPTAQELTRELAGKGLLVQRIRKKPPRLSGLGRRRLSGEEFLLFNQELTAILRAGLPIPEALRLVADRRNQPLLGGVLAHVLDQVRAGKLLSEACAQHPEIFDGLYVAALRTGEKTGALVTVLNGYQESLKAKIAFEKKVSQALAYPLFLLITLSAILGILFVFVMPRFTAMYADFDAKLPLPTRLLAGFVEHLPLFAVPLAGGGALVWLLWRRWTATDAGALWRDRAKARLPLWGGLHRQLAVARFARTLATLLAGGTPLTEAMRATEHSLADRAYARQVRAAATRVEQGEGLVQALRVEAMMPGIPLKMLEAGEVSGALDAMLAQVAQYYEETVSSRLARMTVLIEPLLMLLMGILIGGIIIVMYLPIFYMAEVVR